MWCHHPTAVLLSVLMSWDGVKWMWGQHRTAVSLSVSMFWDGVKWRFREGKISAVFHGWVLSCPISTGVNFIRWVAIAAPDRIFITETWPWPSPLSLLNVLENGAHGPVFFTWTPAWPVAPLRVPARTPTDQNAGDAEDEAESEDEEPHFDADVCFYNTCVSAYGARIYQVPTEDISTKLCQRINWSWPLVNATRPLRFESSRLTMLPELQLCAFYKY